MKNKDFRNSRLKDTLRRDKEAGKKYIIRKLTIEQLEYVQQLGYYIEDYIYIITIRTFFDIHHINEPILKEIHYKSKAKKRTYVRKLNKKEKQILEKKGIKFRVYKYKIYLNKSNKN